ncbi:dethiobiotin synthase [Spirulina sp. CS-785/01]|uniref:dethiobiotin synthase n=1 Tax=Spirulina sp. CS-785/01 TaxID=3021716 RepID=UPI00232E1745|nr:dethiobiotin synthase [Spirulina sp. CS-785/01]MDB9312907.1 dethiobiotin synthase [Spirulina sp. CS-785/01]
MKPLLITGTDTEVGKTVLTTALVAYWQTYKTLDRLGLMKLLQTGEGDRELYQDLFTLPQPPETIAPLVFKTPVAPPIAAEREGQTIDLAPIWQTYQYLQQDRDFVIVEALGGLGSPVTWELTVAEIGAAWQMRTILVVPVKLGAISQVVANVALARQMKLEIAGIVLNCVQEVTAEQQAQWTPIELIESLTQVQVLGTMPYLADTRDIDKLAQVAANLTLELMM